MDFSVPQDFQDLLASFRSLLDREVPTPVLMDLPEHLRGKFVEPLVRGETTMCFALTEPGAGSDAQSISTTAALDGTEWVLSGTKHFITNGARADVAIVMAVTD